MNNEVEAYVGELQMLRSKVKKQKRIIEELKNQLFNLFPWDFRITEIAGT